MRTILLLLILALAGCGAGSMLDATMPSDAAE